MKHGNAQLERGMAVTSPRSDASRPFISRHLDTVGGWRRQAATAASGVRPRSVCSRDDRSAERGVVRVDDRAGQQPWHTDARSHPSARARYTIRGALGPGRSRARWVEVPVEANERRGALEAGGPREAGRPALGLAGRRTTPPRAGVRCGSEARGRPSAGRSPDEPISAAHHRVASLEVAESKSGGGRQR